MEFLPEPLRAALPASVLDAPPAAVAAAVAVVLLSLYLVLKPSGGRAFRGWKAGPGGVFLSKQRVAVPLVARTQMSPDVVRFRFGLPTPTTVLGLPIGSHFKVFAPNVVGTEPGKWNGRDDSEAGHSEIERKYTPTSSDEDLGYFELMLKIYSGGEKPQFVDGGKMSQFLDSLEIGDCVDIQGPFGMTKCVLCRCCCCCAATTASTTPAVLLQLLLLLLRPPATAASYYYYYYYYLSCYSSS